jgi:hypothetical protein
MSSAPYWTAAEDTLLREHYPTATNAELQTLFPTRPLGGIRQRAHQIGIHKNIEAHERGMPFDGSVIRHLSEAEKGYLAGIIDGEGHIGLSRRPGKHGAPIYHIRVVIANTSMALHHWLEQRLPGAGYIMQDTRKKLDARPNTHSERWKTAYKWVIAGNRVALVFLREMVPYLVIKRAQAELLASGYVHLSAAEREELYARLRQLRHEA